MADLLKPDRTSERNGVSVYEYFLTDHNPNGIDMPSDSMKGRIIGVTVHNTDRIVTADGTTQAEQYTRATYNGNMNDVRVHFYVDDKCAWQNLPLDLSGWHAADGRGNGNAGTVSIECIMSGDGTEADRKAEDNCARLTASLLREFGLDTDAVYTHSHWYSGKTCPVYILPHWEAFIAKTAGYLGAVPGSVPLYRVRRSWEDAASQTGAYAVKENAVKACTPGYSVFDENGKTVYSVPALSSYAPGSPVTLKNKELFASSTDAPGTGALRSGTYYFYDGTEVNGRYRITNTPANAGKKPYSKYVTGWIEL